MHSTFPLVDLEFGLSQLSGKRDLLITLLGKFMDEYRDFESRLTPLMTTDNAAAKQQVHTLKGVSGNLGLKALHESAKLLEGDLMQDAPSGESFQAFIDVLNGTFDEITQLSLSTENADQVVPQDAGDNGHNPAPLLEALERNEYIPPGKLDTLMGNIQCDAPTRENLINAINDLDYAKAIALLRG